MRLIIKLHLINGLYWRDVARRYAMHYVDELTEPALKQIMNRGLDRMLKHAETIGDVHNTESAVPGME